MGMAVAGLVVAVAVFGVALAWDLRERTETAQQPLSSFDSIPEEYWKGLSEKKIFFGHQSVGQNIIDGLIDVMDEHPEFQLDIVESSDLTSVVSGSFIHCKIGRNTRAKSKLLAFRRALESDLEKSVDIALMKFCYVDLGVNSSPQDIFDIYCSTMSALKQIFPETIFVHSTIPIESRTASPTRALKEIIKGLIGKPGVVEDNSVRQDYNELLRSHYSGREPVFDIARIEAIGPDDSMAFRLVGNEKVFFMNNRYTDDGGHLNERGRKRVAEQLLITLARAANESSPSGPP